MSADIDIDRVAAECRASGNVAPLLQAAFPDATDDAILRNLKLLPLNLRRVDPYTHERNMHKAKFIRAYQACQKKRGFDRKAFDLVYPDFETMPDGSHLEESTAIYILGSKRPAAIRKLLKEIA